MLTTESGDFKGMIVVGVGDHGGGVSVAMGGLWGCVSARFSWGVTRCQAGTRH